MTEQIQVFAFDESGSLEKNLTAFGDYIVGLNAELGAEISAVLDRRTEGDQNNEEIWKRLFAISAAPPLEDEEPEVAEGVSPETAGAARATIAYCTITRS